jgi:uncharacterized repeat protein (TIGR04042 family)
MPEMTFDVRWPDGRVQACYSPSLVIHDHLETGVDYTIDDFMARVSTALNIAAERVKAKYGFYCSSAMRTLDAVEFIAAQFRAAQSSPSAVRVVSMTPTSVEAATSGVAR